MKEFRVDRLANSSEENFREVLNHFARIYAPYIGFDFDKDLLPKLGDKHWWEADYGVKSRKGKSIGMSSADAFRCLVDTHRTFQLAQGIKETVEHFKGVKEGELIGIDAGTGTGILSILMLAYGMDRVYAIEVNKETREITEKFLKKLGLEDRIVLLGGDATRIKIRDLSKKKAQVLVSENLSGGLFDEPQYDIINHLSNFLAPEAEVVPFGAELFVSLGLANWDGIDLKRNNIAARRLKELYKVSPMISYARVESTVGMPVPIIDSAVPIPTSFEGPINTLLISTRFQINRVGTPFYLNSDTAQFLGKTSAFRLDKTLFAENGGVNVALKYETGRNRKHVRVSVNGNSIKMLDTLL